MIARIDPEVDIELLDGVAVIHIHILFHFLAEHIAQVTLPGSKILVTAYDTQVCCTKNDQDTSQLEPCQHEEADSRLMICVADCVRREHGSVAIKTVDRYVVALSVAVAAELDITQLIWVAFGLRKALLGSLQYLPCADICSP